jgi:hypothetical protein
LAFARGQIELECFPPEGFNIEKPQARGHDITATPSELPIYQEMMEVVTDFVGSQLVRGAPVEPSQVFDCPHVGLLGAGGKAMELELMHHLGA